MTLFEIGEDLNRIAEAICDAEGVVDDGPLEEWFDEIMTARDEKVDDYCRLIASLEARIAARSAEVKRLQSLIKSDQTTVDRLKDRLKIFVEGQGGKVETTLHKLTVAKNGGKVPLLIPSEWRDDPSQAPEAYHRRKIELDLDAIRVGLEAGDDIPGCALLERSTSLRIK
jgi:hypothetical protein